MTSGKKENRNLLIDVNKAGKSWRSGGPSRMGMGNEELQFEKKICIPCWD